ncbi:HEAT repeat domain-containing protein [Plantactinospora mayteni]|uniref:HEAT repeat domain-containing protein n=1 Tax=Plantactinospora mayteni TaxID=566021 RepID=A0ABQ4F0T1_9ACTN|nr:hypothetical protein [Plantactinospora mayteni]GIH00496.1 hypothetical protein Pma05_70680 [Plantactinospora mayteni]
MTEIDAGEFATLLHAYGRASDTPEHLAALVDADPAGRRAALEHLWSAVIHQGTPWTATPPAAVTVAALLGDPRLSGAADAELRADLLRFLAAVAEAGRSHPDPDEFAPPAGFDVDAALTAALDSGDEDELYADEVMANALYARAVLGCREIVPTLLTAAASALSDPEPTVRAAAAHAVGACCAAPAATTEVMPLARRLDALAAEAGPDERAALVLAMGELGLEPRGYLDDPHPGVRACAALAPALADDPAATAELLAALADPAATDGWFTHRPPQISTWIRFTLVAAAIARVDGPGRLLPAALAIAPIASRYTAQRDWGPLLHALFAGRDPGPLSPAQRRYLGALVDNEDLWDPSNGSVGLVFRDAGLPYDRDACRDLVGESTPSAPTR